MCNIKCIVFILFFFWLLILGLKLMSTSIHFLWTVYNKKMSIYPIINYPIFSENTIIHKFRDTETHVCGIKLQIASPLHPPWPVMLLACVIFSEFFAQYLTHPPQSAAVLFHRRYYTNIPFAKKCSGVVGGGWMWISYKKCQEKWSIYFHSNLLTVAEQTFVKSLSILYNFEYLSAEHLGDSAENSNHLITSASKSSIRRFVITEKASTRAFSWLKAATTAFTFKTLC